MDCTVCRNKEICLINKDVVKYSSYANIEISNCNFFSVINVTSSNGNPNGGVVSNPIKRTKDLEKINSLSRANREEKEKKIKDLVIKTPKLKSLEAIPLALDSVCVACGGNTFKEDIGKCDLCKGPLCSCCATINSDTNEILCSECWEKI